MVRKNLKNFITRVKNELPDSLDVVCFKDSMILRPTTDSLLRTIVFMENRYDKDLYECLAVYLPLYYPLDSFFLSFSKPVLRLEDQRAQLSVSYWALNDWKALSEAVILQALPFLNLASTAQEFATLAPKICSGKSFFLDEIVALSHLRAGHLFMANLELSLLAWTYALQRNQGGICRLKPFRDNLSTGKLGDLFEKTARTSLDKIGYSDAPIS